VKVERFTSDSATLVTLANVHGNNRDDQKVNFGLHNALNLAYVYLQFKKFSRSNTRGPLKREERAKKGYGKEMEGRRRSRDECRRGRYEG
jgi:hypothetical protein